MNHYMEIVIYLLQLLSGLVGATAAIGGDTWRKGPKPVLNRITRRGWFSIAALTLFFTLSAIKEIIVVTKAKEAKVFQEQLLKANKSEEALQKELTAANKSLAGIKEGLESANRKLDRVQKSMAAIGPETLEKLEKVLQPSKPISKGRFSAFANLLGTSRVIPKSKETGKQLVLYDGDLFSWRHSCNRTRNNPEGVVILGRPIQAGNRNSVFILDTGSKQYEIRGKEGKIKISGPAEKPMDITILNPMRYESCSIKMVVNSTKQTREDSQFESLIKAIRDTKAALK